MKHLKTKLLACLVIVMLVVSATTITAFAADPSYKAYIGGTGYETLAEAITAASGMTGDVSIELAEGLISENVIVKEYNDLHITIKGHADGTIFVGQIELDGQPDGYSGNGSVHIKDIHFEASDVENNAYIYAPQKNASNQYSYPHNVTVENCTFTDTDASIDVAAVKLSSGVWNLSIKGCSVDNTMHSLLQLATGSRGLEVSGCTVESKNGISLGTSTDVFVEGNDFSVKGYALRIGHVVGVAVGPVIALTNNTIHTDGSEGDAAIIIRGCATGADLTIEENSITTGNGAPHIGVTGMADTSGVSISAEKNYWGEGLLAPVVDNFTVEVWESYKDANRTQLEVGGNSVASINGILYFSFEEALKAASASDVILLANDLTLEKAFNIAGGSTVVIDLNGKTLRVAGDNAINNNSTVTIQNGTLDVTGAEAHGDAIFVLHEPNVTLNLIDVDVVGDGYSSAYGIFYIKEEIIEHYGSILGKLGGKPMYRALNLTAVYGHIVLGLKIGCTMHLYDITSVILDYLIALDDVRTHQAHLTVGLHSEELRGGYLCKVVRINVKLSGKGQFTCA